MTSFLLRNCARPTCLQVWTWTSLTKERQSFLEMNFVQSETLDCFFLVDLVLFFNHGDFELTERYITLVLNGYYALVCCHYR